MNWSFLIWLDEPPVCDCYDPLRPPDSIITQDCEPDPFSDSLFDFPWQ